MKYGKISRVLEFYVRSCEKIWFFKKSVVKWKRLDLLRINFLVKYRS